MLSGHQFLMQLQLAVVCLCDSFIFLVQSNLTILMVNDATIGNYSAMIDDTRTEPITTPAQLVSPHVSIHCVKVNGIISPLIVPPTLVSLTSSMGCLLDSTEVRLTCVANGLPTPVITFRKGLDPLTCDPGSSCNISGNVLIFTRVYKIA